MRRPRSASRCIPRRSRTAGRSGLLGVIGLLVGGLILTVVGVRPAHAAIPVAPAAGPRLARIGAAPRVPAGSTALGAVAAGSPVQVTVALTPRDPAGLAAYAQAVATPGSGVYHHYLSVAAFGERFGADPSQIAAVQEALRAQGLSPSAPTANRLELSITAPAGTLETAFATSLERFRLPDGARAVASLAAPAVPAGVAALVQGVVGLSSLSTPRPSALIRRPVGRHPIRLARAGRVAHLVPGGSAAGAGAPGEAAACGAAATSGAYTAAQIAGAYGFSALYGAGDGGAGQTIALFELEPYAASDIAAYQGCYGTSAPVTPISVDGGAGSGSGSGEAALDIEDVIGLAPRASVLVYEGPNSGAGAYDTYARMISDDRAKVISTSWGACEDPWYANALQAEATLYQEAAAQGQTVLAAAGDSGADDCGTGAGAAVDDPASQPDVTGVGGTTLSLAAGGHSESVWNSTWSGGAGAGGGGVSSIWPRPSYQTAAVAGAATGCGSGQTACREVPDVSADADVNTGYAIYFQGGWYDFGGTSAATPTWAALIALTDAWSGCPAPVGFLNPGLYRAGGAASGAAAVFNDITLGNNSFGGVPGYSASAGYDLASGWGSPRGSALAGALCGTAAPGTGSTGTGAGSSAAPAGGVSGSGTTGTGSGTTTGTGAGGGTTTGTGGGTTTGTGAGGGTTTGTGTGGGTTSGTGTGTTATGTTTTAGNGTGGTPADPSGAVPAAPTSNPAPTTAPATSPAPAVIVAVAASARGIVGRHLSVVPRAVDTAARRMIWLAENLPAGLSLDPATGAISGRPRQASDSRVTLTATDTAGASGSATVRLVIVGAPVVTRQITFPGRERVQIAIRARAGQFSLGIRRLVFTLHSRLVRLPSARDLRRLLRLRGPAGQPLAAAVRRLGNSVIVSLSSPVSVVAVRLAAVAVRARAGSLATVAATRRPLTPLSVIAT